MKLTIHIFCVRQIQNSLNPWTENFIIPLQIVLWRLNIDGIRRYYVPYLLLLAVDVIGTIFHQQLLLNLLINVNTLFVKLSPSIQSIYVKNKHYWITHSIIHSYFSETKKTDELKFSHSLMTPKKPCFIKFYICVFIKKNCFALVM